MDAKIYKSKKYIAFFLIPAFLFMAVYLYYPFIQNILISFQKIKLLGTPSKGLLDPVYKNYLKMFEEIWKDGKFNTTSNLFISLKNTIITIAATMIGQVGLALLLSLLISNIKKGAGFFRVVFFFPIVVSATALGLLFNLLFLYDGGMINQLLMHLGIIHDNFDWKAQVPIFTMLTPVIWQYVGFYFVILLTGISGISEELYEAASIDGATKFQSVKYITLPLLKNSISTCVILAVTGALKVFDLPWTMFPKGMSGTWLTGTYMYERSQANVSYSAAISILIVVLGVVLSAVVNRLFKTDDDLDM
jgi:raffinose/stachyose/melibiose transport system permease protein